MSAEDIRATAGLPSSGSSPQAVSPADAASIPVANARVVYQRDVIAAVARRFREQYKRYDQGHTFSDGYSVRQIIARLGALDLSTCSEADVDAAMGLTGWAGHECDLCGVSKPILIRLGDEPDYEARWQDVCAECLDGCLRLLAQAIEARQGGDAPAAPSQDESAVAGGGAP